jgi:hypothetical protein
MEQEWSVPDVYLLAEGPGGEMAVPHLTLTFLDSGLALEKANGEPVWDGAWVELEEMAPVARSVLPDGRDGVVIVVVERDHGRRHHFVLTTDDLVATEIEVRGRAAAHGLRTAVAPPAVSRALTVVVVVTALATLAVLLLSAAHVIHF